MAAYKSKGVGRSQGKSAPGAREEVDGANPLANTLMQEFQSLKDKFKNEDEDYHGLFPSFSISTFSFLYCRITISISRESNCAARMPSVP